MRIIHTLPLAAAVLLAACGGSETDADGDGELSSGELAAEASDMVQPRPGQYTASLELLEFDAPGMPEAAKEQMQQIFASGLAQGNSFCMTEEDASENGPRQMVENLAEQDCEMKTFNVSGGSVVAEMQCSGEGGPSTLKMEGEMTAESSTMTMDMTQETPGIEGGVRMKMRVNSQRTGDCAA